MNLEEALSWIEALETRIDTMNELLFEHHSVQNAQALVNAFYSGEGYCPVCYEDKESEQTNA